MAGSLPRRAPSPAELPPVGARDVVYLIDVSGYVHRAYHALPPMATSSGEPTNATYGTTSMLQRLLRERRPAYLAAAMDSRAPLLRKLEYEPYKAKRPAHPPDLAPQMDRVREVLEAYRIPVLLADGYEADDLVASAARLARSAQLRVVVVGSDKDLMQLVGPDLVLFDPTRNAVLGELEVEAKLGVPPARVCDYLALVGDSSDNVPGVAGVGPKTAVELLARFGSLDALYARLDEVERPALRARLAEHRPEAELSRRLVTLHDEVKLGLRAEDLAATSPDSGKLRELFAALEIERLAVELPRPAFPPRSARRYETAESAVAVAHAVAQARQAAALDRPVGVEVALAGHDAMRARARGVGLGWSTGVGAYVPLRNEGVPEPLAALLADAEVPKTVFDLAEVDLALRRAGAPLEGVTFDALAGAALVDPDRAPRTLGELARAELDVEVRPPPAQGDLLLDDTATPTAEAADVVGECTLHLYPRVEAEGLLALLHEVELPLARVLSRMRETGVRVDVRELRALSADCEEELARLEHEAHELAGRRFAVASPRQLEAILFDELSLPVVRRTKTARSTDADVLEVLEEHHPLPRVILEHRQVAKLKSTYLDALPNAVLPATGRIHTRFHAAGAATGRISSSDPNLQNIPVRSPLGKKIRRAFVAPEGHRIVAADYSQVELRVLAHLSGDPVLCAAFRNGEDVHRRTAMLVFGVDEQAMTPELRHRAKAINFGVVYGQTDFGLARELRIERREAAAFIAAYFERYAGVARYMEEAVEQARRSGFSRTMLGRKRWVPDLRSNHRAARLAAERVARNTPIQGTAADMIKVAMVHLAARLEARAMRSRMVLTVHDELVLECPEDEVAAARTLVIEAMQGAAELSVPVVVDVGDGPSWGEAK